MKAINFKKVSIIGLGILLCFNSCDKDKLDTPPLSVNENAFFKNENDFIGVMAGAYGKITDWYWFRASSGNFIGSMFHLPADDITSVSGNYETFELFAGINPTTNQVEYFWHSTYELIGRANFLIEKAESADPNAVDTDFSQEFLNQIKGEALFLRALAFFKLYNMYGTAPILTERIVSLSEVNTPKSEGVQLLDQAITDLNEAVQLLPDTWPDYFAGRATKNSAYGLLTKALVFRGDYSGSTADYTAAVQAYNSISGKSLTADYTDNFSALEENNAESLFEFQASENTGMENPWLQNDGPWRGAETMTAYWGFYTLSGPPRNNLGGNNWKVTQKMYNAYGNDPRVAYFTEPNRDFTKYGKEGLDMLPRFNFQPSSLNNPRILRLADVKLLAAEAMLLSGGSKTTAIELINEVRARASEWALSLETPIEGVVLPEPHNTAETNDATIMQWIEDERAIELLGEEQVRWFDLKRWDARGYKSLQGWDGSDQYFSTDQEAGMQFEYPKNLLWPIPQTEIERNSAITTNNPGY